ncbi:MAG: hypothetical protein GY772_31760, partial [bacterium]|nr:hypothetical protein [bacterium]
MESDRAVQCGPSECSAQPGQWGMASDSSSDVVVATAPAAEAVGASSSRGLAQASGASVPDLLQGRGAPAVLWPLWPVAMAAGRPRWLGGGTAAGCALRGEVSEARAALPELAHGREDEPASGGELLGFAIVRSWEVVLDRAVCPRGLCMRRLLASRHNRSAGMGFVAHRFDLHGRIVEPRPVPEGVERWTPRVTRQWQC